MWWVARCLIGPTPLQPYAHPMHEELPFPGLQNLGNTCYLNTALQALASSPAFVEYLQRASAAVEAARQPPQRPCCHIAACSRPHAGDTHAAASQTQQQQQQQEEEQEQGGSKRQAWHKAVLQHVRQELAALWGEVEVTPWHSSSSSSRSTVWAPAAAAAPSHGRLTCGAGEQQQQQQQQLELLTQLLACLTALQPQAPPPPPPSAAAAAAGRGCRGPLCPGGVRGALLRHLPAGELALGEQHDAAEALQALVAGVCDEVATWWAVAQGGAPRGLAWVGQLATPTATAGTATATARTGPCTATPADAAAVAAGEPGKGPAVTGGAGGQTAAAMSGTPHGHPSPGSKSSGIIQASRHQRPVRWADARAAADAALAAAAAAAATGTGVAAGDTALSLVAAAAAGGVGGVGGQATCAAPQPRCHLTQAPTSLQACQQQQQQPGWQQQQQQGQGRGQQAGWQALCVAPCQGLVAYPLTCTTCGHTFTTSLQRFTLLPLPLPNSSSRRSSSAGWLSSSRRSSSSGGGALGGVGMYSSSVQLEECLAALLRPQLVTGVACERCSLAATVRASRRDGRGSSSADSSCQQQASGGNTGAVSGHQQHEQQQQQNERQQGCVQVAGQAGKQQQQQQQLAHLNDWDISSSSSHQQPPGSTPADTSQQQQQQLLAAAEAALSCSVPLPPLPFERCFSAAGTWHQVTGRALQQVRVVALPRVLLLQLGRAVHTYGGRGLDKASQHVAFPQVLDMAPYVGLWDAPPSGAPTAAASSQRRQQLYQLVAVGQHIGGGSSGHYLLYRRTPPVVPPPTHKAAAAGLGHSSSAHNTSSSGSGSSNGPAGSRGLGSSSSPSGTRGSRWWCVSDASVRPVSWEVVAAAQASLLVYQAQG